MHPLEGTKITHKKVEMLKSPHILLGNKSSFLVVVKLKCQPCVKMVSGLHFYEAFLVLLTTQNSIKVVGLNEKVSRLHCLGTINVGTKCYGNPSHNC